LHPEGKWIRLFEETAECLEGGYGLYVDGDLLELAGRRPLVLDF
jgi:hypothetical protein